MSGEALEVPRTFCPARLKSISRTLLQFHKSDKVPFESHWQMKTKIFIRVWALSKSSNAVCKELELCSGKMYTFVIHVLYTIHERVKKTAKHQVTPQ